MGDIQYTETNGRGSMKINGYHISHFDRTEPSRRAKLALDFFYDAPEHLSEMISAQYIKWIRAYRYEDVNWAGRAVHKRNRMGDHRGLLQLNFYMIDSDKSLKSVVLHEMAHFLYYKLTRQNSEKLQKFNDEILTDKYFIDDYSKRKIRKWSNELFCNEIHSILTEYKYAEHTCEHDDKSKATLVRYMKAYNRLHDLV